MRQNHSGKRHNKVGCGILAAFCLFVVGGYLAWANQPLPLETKERPLPEPNGFVLAIDAASRLSPTPSGSPIADRKFTDAKVLRDKLAPDEPQLDDLRKSLRMEWGIPPVQDLSQKFPYLAEFRQAGRELAAESRLALAEGRPGDAAERALDAVELGARVGSRAPLIHYLTGVSLSAIGTDQADRVAPKLSAAEAQRVGARMDRIIAGFPTAADAFREERGVALATLLRMFRGELDPRAVSSETRTTPPPTPRATPPWFLYPKPWSYRSMDRGFRSHIAEAEKPYSERQPVPLPREPLARLLLPILDQALMAAERNRTSLRILRLEVALQEYRGRQGVYPASLAALTPQILHTVPDDPYSGQSFIYRPGAGSYRLYSVGPNLKDDGGVPILGDFTQRTASGDLVAGRLGYRKRR